MREVHNVLRRAPRLQVSLLIRKPDNGVGVPHVHPLRVASRRIEGNAVGAAESAGENASLPRFTTSGDSAEHFDFSAAAFCQEKVTVGRRADQPRIIESRGVALYRETGRSLRPSI